MPLLKNTASQNVTFPLISATTGAVITGATLATIKSSSAVTKDGTQAGCAGTFTETGLGQYNYAPTQSETNATDVGFLFAYTGAIAVNADFHTDLALSTQVPTALTYDGNGLPKVDLVDAAGTAVTLDTNNVLNVSTKYVGGTLQTAGDIYGYLTTNLGLLGANLTAVSGIVWNALTSALTTTGSIGKKLAGWVLGSDSKVLLSTDAQTGVTIPAVTAVTNAVALPSSATISITGNITGNLSGSVGSVTGAVGSVTGAVGSVTGAVGSVTGSVGSISGVTFPTGFSTLTTTAIATASATAILVTPANKLATDGSGDVTYNNAAPPSSSAIATAAAAAILANPSNKIVTDSSGFVTFNNVDLEGKVLGNSGSSIVGPGVATVEFGGLSPKATQDGQQLVLWVLDDSGNSVATATNLATANSGISSLQTQVGTAGAGLTALGDTRIAHLNADVNSRSAPGTAQTTDIDAVLAPMISGGAYTTAALANAPSGGGGTAANITVTPLICQISGQAGIDTVLTAFVGGALANLSIGVFDNLGQPVDLSGLTLKLRIYDPESDTTLATITSFTISGTSNNWANCTIPSSDNPDTANVRWALWDVTNEGNANIGPVRLCGGPYNTNDSGSPP